MAQVVAAVLGIVITVVSIVVQLAATRYTSRIADMFFRDRTNLGVMGFFVVACIDAVWVDLRVAHRLRAAGDHRLHDDAGHRSLLILVPYFAYVFDFLDPERVVGRIQQQAVAAALDAARRSAGDARAAPAARARRRRAALRHRGERRSQKDKVIASGAVDAMRRLRSTTCAEKKAVHAEWFAIGDALRANPDFVSLADESLEDLARKRIWLEWKVLRQYQRSSTRRSARCRRSPTSSPSTPATSARRRSPAGDGEVLALAVKFINTYLRATLNGADVRTAYNVLNQYRQLAETLLAARARTARVGEIAATSSTTRRSRTRWISASSPRRRPTISARCARSPFARCTPPAHDRDARASSSRSTRRPRRQAQEHDAARRAQGAGQAGLVLPRRRGAEGVRYARRSSTT